MIKTFAHKGLKAFFETGTVAGIASIHVNKLRLILAMLDQAQTVQDMAAPALRLHELKGRDKGTWAVTVQANWRITFKYSNGNAYVVDYKDYH